MTGTLPPELKIAGSREDVGPLKTLREGLHQKCDTLFGDMILSRLASGVTFYNTKPATIL
ncbi:MAG: hypothetical protein EBR81_02355 [Proteobacteria bacterium]|nr:hypothetical protein [Pseudomonadota bacterium]